MDNGRVSERAKMTESLEKSMNNDESSSVCSVLAPNSKRKRRASKSNPNIVLSGSVTDEAMPALAERNSLVTDEPFRERVIEDTNSPSHFNALTNSEHYNTVQTQHRMLGHGTNRRIAAETSD